MQYILYGFHVEEKSDLSTLEDTMKETIFTRAY